MLGRPSTRPWAVARYSLPASAEGRTVAEAAHATSAADSAAHHTHRPDPEAEEAVGAVEEAWAERAARAALSAA